MDGENANYLENMLKYRLNTARSTLYKYIRVNRINLPAFLKKKTKCASGKRNLDVFTSTKVYFSMLFSMFKNAGIEF